MRTTARTRPAMLIFLLLCGFLGLSLQASSGIQPVDAQQVTSASTVSVPQDSLVPAAPEPPRPSSVKDTAQEVTQKAAPAVTAPTEAAPTAPQVRPATAEPPAAEAPPAASSPLKIRYEAAGMDVAVFPLAIDQTAEQTQSIVPPFTLDGYWLTDFGVPGAGSANTTYIVGHSWDDRDAPFNRLSSHAAPGHTFEVSTGTGTLTYRVDSVTTYVKSELKSADIWTIQPNRIVLISCYTADPWGKNVVVTATPVSR